MPAAAPPTSKTTAAKLRALGARLRTHRKSLGLSATIVAEAAGMSRKTLQRIEAGEPSVTMAAYYSAISVLGLDIEVIDPRQRKLRMWFPMTIPLLFFPHLKRLAWQLDEATVLTPKEAFSIYE